MSHRLGAKKREDHQALLSQSVAELRLVLMQNRIRRKLGHSIQTTKESLPPRVFRATIARILTQATASSSTAQKPLPDSKQLKRLHQKSKR